MGQNIARGAVHSRRMVREVKIFLLFNLFAKIFPNPGSSA